MIIFNGKLAPYAFQLGKFAQTFVPFRLRLEFFGIERALAGKAGRLEKLGEIPGPCPRRFFRLVLQRKSSLQNLPENRAVRRRADELGKRHGCAERLAQARIEPRAAGHLGVRAAEEGRADEPARARELDLAERELDERERRVDERVLRERLAERDVERRLALRRAEKQVAGLHRA